MHGSKEESDCGSLFQIIYKCFLKIYRFFKHGGWGCLEISFSLTGETKCFESKRDSSSTTFFSVHVENNNSIWALVDCIRDKFRKTLLVFPSTSCVHPTHINYYSYIAIIIIIIKPMRTFPNKSRDITLAIHILVDSEILQ